MPRLNIRSLFLFRLTLSWFVTVLITLCWLEYTGELVYRMLCFVVRTRLRPGWSKKLGLNVTVSCW